MTALAYVEQIVGRPLRLAEQAIDVLKLDQALNQAKDDLDAAVAAEQARAVRRTVREGWSFQLEVTRPMLAPLERLFRLGRREAYAELERLGYDGIRRGYAADPEHPELAGHAAYLDAALRGLAIRLERERINIEFASPGQDAIIRALLKVPGARSIAAAAITSALTAGLAQTFEANADLVDGWEYTSVLDSGTCDVCAPLDGTTYRTLDELYSVLPNFGPNPFCLGGDRCRCRAVPAAP